MLKVHQHTDINVGCERTETPGFDDTLRRGSSSLGIAWLTFALLEPVPVYPLHCDASLMVACLLKAPTTSMCRVGIVVSETESRLEVRVFPK